MFDLSNTTRQELLSLQKEIEKRLKQLEKEDRKAALAAAEEVARERGFTLEELTGGKPAAKAKAPAKYRDPQSGKEWSGRGRRPAWLKDVTDLSPYEI